MTGLCDAGNTGGALRRKKFLAQLKAAYLAAQGVRQNQGCIHIGRVDCAQDFLERGCGHYCFKGVLASRRPIVYA